MGEQQIRVDTNAVELTATESAGLGLVAKQDMDSGRVLIQVPETLALAVEQPGEGPNDNGRLERACRSGRGTFSLRELPWFVQFSLYLHTLKKQTENSVDWNPWLNSLPTHFDTPIHWNPQQRQEALHYDAMVESVAQQEASWKSYYQQISPTFPSLTWDEFVWGCETARSRAFSGSTTGRFNPKIYAFTLLLVTAYVALGMGTLDQAANGAGVVVSATILRDFVLPKFFKKKLYVICPLIDMANHNSVDPGAQVSLEYFANAYSLTTTKPIRKGASVEISYGSRSNDQLLQYYGFIEPDSPSDVYLMPPLREWPLEAMEQATGRTVAVGRLEALDRVGLLGRGSTSEENDGNPLGRVVVNRAVGVDPAAIQALRALLSTDSEWNSAGNSVGNFAEPVSAENERAALLAAGTALKLELLSKPATLEQDMERLQKRVNGGRLEKELASQDEIMAIQFRIEKKKLLKETIEKLGISI